MTSQSWLLMNWTLILGLKNNKIGEIRKTECRHHELSTLSLTGNPLSNLKYVEMLPNLTSIAVEGKEIKTISKPTYDFIREKQSNSQNTDDPFYFFTAHTTTRKKIDSFVKKQSIRIV